MMKFIKLAGIPLLCIVFTGCSIIRQFKEINYQVTPVDTTEPPPMTEPQTEPITLPPTEPTPETLPEPETEAETVPLSPREIYRKLLSNLLANGEISGHHIDLKSNSAQNQFAILDIDNDGKEELLIHAKGDSTDKILQLVLDIGENGNIFKELDVFSDNVTYYHNGNLTAQLSSKQGFSDSFIPYTLYQYDNDSDGYAQVVTVSAMEKDFLSEKELEDIYPEDADTSHSGVVYYIGSDNPVDVTEYQEWCQSWQNQTSVLEIPFQEITEEYIKTIQ